MHAEGQARRRWPGLDGLRGIAVLAVLGFHAGIEHFVGGYLGVEVFFALSGFLITVLLLDEFGRSGRINLRAFWGRRARRILPALFLVVAITGVLWEVVGTATQRADLSGDVFSAFAFMSNWHEIATGTGYLAANSVPSPLLHTWSIAIEEQWYLVWPLVILGSFLLLRRTRHALMAGAGLCAAGAIGSSLLMAFLAGRGTTGRAYYGTDTRAAALLVGAAVAFAFCHAESTRANWLWSRTASRTLTVLAATALIGLGAAAATVDHEAAGLYRGGFLLVSLATVTVVVACVHPIRNPVARLLSIAPLRWVGVISYGIYLWHWPVFLLLTPDRTGLSGTPLTIVRVVVSIALAWLSWHLIEQPIRLRRLRPRIWVPAYTAVAAVAIVVLVFVSASQPGFKLPEASALRRRPAPASTSEGAKRPHLFFVGDSIALTLGAGVSSWADQTGRAVVTGHPLLGCGLMDDIKRRRPGTTADPPDYCASWSTRWGLEVAHQRPDAALLVLSVWDLQEHAVDGKNFTEPGDAAFDGAFLARLDAAVGVLSSTGARVGLVTLPVLTNEDAHAAGTTSAIPEEQPRVMQHVDDLLRNYASTHHGTFLVDIAREVRGETQYPQEYRGVPLFADGSHFTPEAGAMLSPWIVGQVTQALALPSGS
jgi:peptidoglycan/LPS O-acetylase OafA/YrhL